MRFLAYAFITSSALLTQHALAIPVTDNLDLGGAIRARVDYDPDEDIKKFNFDTIALSAQYNSSSFIGAARYWFYGKAWPYQYTDKIGDISFAEFAWLGYKFNEQSQIQIGLNQIPFGLQPYFGSTFIESLGYLIGLEDVSMIGAKYIQKSDDWDFQLGYYLRPAWQGKGTSDGGATYSNVIAKSDSYVENGTNNREKNTVVGRLTKSITLGGWQTELGASGYSGSLKNNDTNGSGRRNAISLHAAGKKGKWGVQLLAARQVISPSNPNNDEMITFGGYDTTFNVASRGNLYVGDLSYDIEGSYIYGLINNVKIYTNYSKFDKDKSSFRDSQRAVLGLAYYIGDHLLITNEWLFGKNDPYVGASDYLQSLGKGGSDQWENQLSVNIGYYF
ncbi:hypothetical protein ACIQT6_11420 [Pseudomonas asiatica]|uniref:hypothetical protein n=1 Tax=Pseudomonas asiatica TaxID=2219225 RepID=UPI003839F628